MTRRKTQRERIIKDSAGAYQIPGARQPTTVLVPLNDGQARYAPPNGGKAIWLYRERVGWRVI